MPSAISRILFVGLGYFGSNAVFELKKRLSAMQTPDGRDWLIETDNNDTTLNPYQFLFITDKGAAAEHTFLRCNYLNEEADIFATDKELFSPDDDDRFDYFRDALARLTNFNSVVYQKKKGVDVDIYPPAVIFVFDIETYQDERYIRLQDEFLDHSDTLLREKYHSHAVVFAHRYEENRSAFADMEKYYNTLFLMDEESDLILETPDDTIDSAANFLAIITQFDTREFQEKFHERQKAAYYSFGCSSVSFPHDEILLEGIRGLLEENDSDDSPSRGKDFRKLFIGEFKQITSVAIKDIFSLGAYDTEEISDEEIEELVPIESDRLCNRSKIFQDVHLKWLKNHRDMIQEQLHIDSLFKKVKDLTSPAKFLRSPLEDWKKNLDALDFLMHYNIIQSAKIKADSLKSIFLERWKTEVAKQFKEMTKVVDTSGNLVCTKPGELLRHVTISLIKNVKENVLPLVTASAETEDKEGENYSTRKDVEDAAALLPHPLSLIIRFAILSAACVLFWKNSCIFICKRFDIVSSGPAIIISGFLFFVVTAFIFYWFWYGKKQLVLTTHLHSYLYGKLRSKSSELQSISARLAKEFYAGAVSHLRSVYRTRQGFFYELFERNQTDFEHPTLVETYYINRWRTFQYIQSMLYTLQEYGNKSRLHSFVPDPRSAEFSDIIKTILQGFEPFEKILQNLNTADALQEHDFSEPYEQDSDYADIVKRIFKGCYQSLAKELEARRLYYDLRSYLHETEYLCSRGEFTRLTEWANPTFRLRRDQKYLVRMFSHDKDWFSAGQQQIYNHSFDRNNIIFCSIDGPVSISDIQWEAKD